MLLGFSKEFVDDVESGRKRHTIRARRKNRPRAGDTCFCYTGLRTKKCRRLGRWPCVKVDDITIKFLKQGDRLLEISINGELLSPDETTAFAQRDGFRNSISPQMAMRDFWADKHGMKPGSVFHGDLIHWDFDKPVGEL